MSYEQFLEANKLWSGPYSRYLYRRYERLHASEQELESGPGYSEPLGPRPLTELSFWSHNDPSKPLAPQPDRSNDRKRGPE